MATASTEQTPTGNKETPMQKAIREMKERLRKQREAEGKGDYVAPTEVPGPTEIN
jgi:hypothetical protein